MNLQFVDLTKKAYKEWDGFCRDAGDAWFWHTTDCLEYSLNCKPEYKGRLLSFFVRDDTGIIAVCPLIMEEYGHDGHKARWFSNSGIGGFGVVPAFKADLGEKQRDRLSRAVFDHIDKLACEHGVKKALFRFTPLLRVKPTYNNLMKFGYFDASINTQVLDLDLSEEELNQDVRKGHRYDIKRGKKAYTIDIFDKEGIKKEVFEQYRLLHHKAAGKVTRPRETFEMMYQWIVGGKAILCGARNDKGEYVGFSLIIVYGQGAHYASASDDPDIDVEVPVSHVIQWEAIEWLKRSGIRVYETGFQQFGAQIYDHPSKKDFDISFFKRGFGGKTVTLYRGIKYYDDEYMKQDLKNSVVKTMESFKNFAQK